MRIEFDEQLENRVGIVISGDSLVLIDNHGPIKSIFLEKANKSEVVLACRVLPK